MSGFARFELIQPRLDKVADHLAEIFADTHKFLRVSAAQSDAAYERVATHGDFSNDAAIATIVGNTHHVRLFELSLFVSSAVVRRSINASRHAAEANDLLSFLWAIRTLVERFAHIHFLVSKVQASLKGDVELLDREYISTLVFDDIVKNSIYGTLTDWNAIAIKNDLSEVDLKNEIGKGTKEKLGVHGAKQVLDKIDLLNKSVPGSRAAYEILCEFLHPNVGDLFSCTSEYSVFWDRHGVRYIQRLVAATGGHGFEMPTAERAVIDKVFHHVGQLCDTYVEDIRQGRELRDSLIALLVKSTRGILRKNRRFFRRSDPCPCASGQTAHRCCGAGLMLGP